MHTQPDIMKRHPGHRVKGMGLTVTQINPTNRSKDSVLNIFGFFFSWALGQADSQLT
jgi:hypothetical protein